MVRVNVRIVGVLRGRALCVTYKTIFETKASVALVVNNPMTYCT